MSMQTHGQNDTRRDDFLKEIKRLGAENGQGSASRPNAARRGLAASIQGLVGPDDAKEVWGIFQQASAAKRGVEYKVEGSLASQVSKFKHFLTLGQMTGVDTEEMLERACVLIKKFGKDDDTRKSMGGSAYDKMIAVAKAQLLNEHAALTDEEITNILFPEKKEQNEEMILRRVAKTLTRVVDGGKDGQAYPSPQSEQALRAVTNRLDELAQNPANGAASNQSVTAQAMQALTTSSSTQEEWQTLDNDLDNDREIAAE